MEQTVEYTMSHCTNLYSMISLQIWSKLDQYDLKLAKKRKIRMVSVLTSILYSISHTLVILIVGLQL